MELQHPAMQRGVEGKELEAVDVEGQHPRQAVLLRGEPAVEAREAPFQVGLCACRCVGVRLILFVCAVVWGG
jgi:hypothetical protein